MRPARLLFVLALCAVGTCVLVAGPAPAEASAPRGRAVWQQRHQRWYCKVDGKKLTGLRTVGGKTYLFSKKGAQRTGWHQVGGLYRFFEQKNGRKGCMVRGRVVNGVKLLKNGVAVGGKGAGRELRLMARASKIAEARTRAGWSQTRKLKAVWRWMQKDCTFRSARSWHNWDGRHRLYANDILFGGGGDCDSWAAGFTYLANACGAKRCSIIASGGHGWAEVNGKVYDLQMSGYHGYRYFAYPYHGGGRAGAPAYASNRRYIVKIAPRTKRWSHASDRATASKKHGLVRSGKTARWYDVRGKMLRSSWKTVGGARYWFASDGRAARGPAKVRGVRYVFDGKCRLSRGKSEHVATMDGTLYRVSKSGRALSGWYAGQTRYAYADGEIATGPRLIGKKIWAFGEAGVVDAKKSAAIRRAAVPDADPAPLIELLGAPVRVDRATSCFWQTAADGSEQSGEDVTYRYPHLSVYCFEVTQAGAPDEGRAFFKSAYR